MLSHDDYAAHDAVGLAALVRDEQVTSADLVAAARARLAEVNPRLNAVVTELDPPVRDTAAPHDAPFAGVPFLLKDLGQDLAGHPTSGGSRSMVDVPAVANAEVVDRWLAAGLVVLGRTNTPELGAKGVTEPAAHGPSRNPWDLDRTPGGSSGGSAAAVAAGVVPCAAASDGGGSIRIPASACGLVGLKAGRGLLPVGPTVGETISGTTVDGVVSRTVRDTAAMLDVLAGASDVQPFLPAPPEESYAAQVGRDPGRLRVAVCAASRITPEVHPAAVAAVHRAAQLLAAQGHDVVELDEQPVDDEVLAQDFLTSWFVHCARSVDDFRARSGAGDEGFEPDTLLMAALGRATSATTYVAAVENRHAHVRRLAAFHRDHDLLLTPTTATPPPRVGQFDLPAAAVLGQRALLRARVAGLLRFTPLVQQLIRENLGWVPYTQLANLTGRPAISLPLHRTPEGLPMGVQLVGRLGSEGLLVRLAAQLEDAAPWAHLRPAL